MARGSCRRSGFSIISHHDVLDRGEQGPWPPRAGPGPRPVPLAPADKPPAGSMPPLLQRVPHIGATFPASVPVGQKSCQSKASSKTKINGIDRRKRADGPPGWLGRPDLAKRGGTGGHNDRHDFPVTWSGVPADVGPPVPPSSIEHERSPASTPAHRNIAETVGAGHPMVVAAPVALADGGVGRPLTYRQVYEPGAGTRAARPGPRTGLRGRASFRGGFWSRKTRSEATIADYAGLWHARRCPRCSFYPTIAAGPRPRT